MPSHPSVAMIHPTMSCMSAVVHDGGRSEKLSSSGEPRIRSFSVSRLKGSRRDDYHLLDLDADAIDATLPFAPGDGPPLDQLCVLRHPPPWGAPSLFSFNDGKGGGGGELRKGSRRGKELRKDYGKLKGYGAGVCLLSSCLSWQTAPLERRTISTALPLPLSIARLIVHVLLSSTPRQVDLITFIAATIASRRRGGRTSGKVIPGSGTHPFQAPFSNGWQENFHRLSSNEHLGRILPATYSPPDSPTSTHPHLCRPCHPAISSSAAAQALTAAAAAPTHHGDTSSPARASSSSSSHSSPFLASSMSPSNMVMR